MKFKTFVSLLIFTLLLLASCNSFLADSAVPTPTETLSPANPHTSPPKETATPEMLSSPTITSLLDLDGPAFAAQKNARHTSVVATSEARGIECKEGFVLEQALDVLTYATDEWTLFTCSPVPTNPQDRWTPGIVDYGTRYTQLIKTNFSQTWTIEHSSFEYSTIDRPDAMLVPLKWTADGKYLYLYPNYYPGPSGFSSSGMLSTLIKSIYRIDLKTGVFELVLQKKNFYDMALSPDDQYLAYSERDNPNIVHIMNLLTGEDSQIEVHEDVLAIGAFVWHPDSTKVLFFVGYEKQSDNWQDDLSATSIFILAPQNMSVRKVLAKDERTFIPGYCAEDYNAWLDEVSICLYSINNELESWNTYFSFNIETGIVEFLRPFP